MEATATASTTRLPEPRRLTRPVLEYRPRAAAPSSAGTSTAAARSPTCADLLLRRRVRRLRAQLPHRERGGHRRGRLERGARSRPAAQLLRRGRRAASSTSSRCRAASSRSCRGRPRPMQVKRVDRVAIAVRDLDAARGFFERGARRGLRSGRGRRRPGFRYQPFTVAGFTLELLCPYRDESVVARFLPRARRGRPPRQLRGRGTSTAPSPSSSARAWAWSRIDYPAGTVFEGQRCASEAFVHPRLAHGLLCTSARSARRERACGRSAQAAGLPPLPRCCHGSGPEAAGSSRSATAASSAFGSGACTSGSR